MFAIKNINYSTIFIRNKVNFIIALKIVITLFNKKIFIINIINIFLAICLMLYYYHNVL
jgi:hypothetical protein